MWNFSEEIFFEFFLLFLFFKKEEFLTFTKKVTCGASEGNHLKNLIFKKQFHLFQIIRHICRHTRDFQYI